MNVRGATTLMVGVGLLAASLTSPCWAIDYQPFDWVPMPPGTGVAMGYYQWGVHGEFNSTISGTNSTDTHLDSHIGIARFLYYQKAWEHDYVLDFVLPFGALDDGRIGGNRLGNASGVGDPLVSFGLWILAQPEHQRYVSAVSFLTLPLGSYDRDKPLNLGSNRWQHDLQVDYTQGFLGKFTIDVSADWIWYGVNDEAGNGRQRLEQDSSFGAYAWLSYDLTSLLRTAAPAAISVGYAGLFGGAQTLDGASMGTKTHEHQLRLTYSQFLTPDWQALVSVNHDVAVSGQFKQDFGLLFRIAKLFM
jgi:hypothetical protein